MENMGVSSWGWIAEAGRYQVERHVWAALRQRKLRSKLLLSKNFLSKAKKRGASRDVHASSRNILVANSTLEIKA